MADVTELKVDYDEVEAALEVLREEVSTFFLENETAFSDDVAMMEAMNSDFIEVFSRILECVPGWSQKYFLKKLWELFDNVKRLMQELQMTDQTYDKQKVEVNNG